MGPATYGISWTPLCAELVFALQTGDTIDNAASTITNKNYRHCSNCSKHYHIIIPIIMNQLVALPQGHTVVCMQLQSAQKLQGSVNGKIR